MKTELNIEWLVETLDYYEGCDGNPDVIEVFHCDSYADAVRWAALQDEPTCIGLVRDRGNDEEGLVDRQWAYIEDGKLPERFDWGGGETGGAKVPARYHNELRG